MNDLFYALEIIDEARMHLEENGIQPTHPMWKQLDTVSSKLNIYLDKYRDRLENIGLV